MKAYHKDHIKYLCAIDFGSFGCTSTYCKPDLPKHYRLLKQTDVEISKDLSALLIHKNTLKVEATGYEAETRYAKIQTNKNDANKYMYFQHFKPQLYKQLQGVTEENKTDIILNENTAKNKIIIGAKPDHKIDLVTLITLSLKTLMNETLKQINNEIALAHRPNSRNNINDEKKDNDDEIPILDIINVFWVITVPAIWDEMSMEIMKLCAKNAGMIDFELGMEPITSTFYALNVSKQGMKMKRNTKFIVLDCGGGTIDAACMKASKINNDEDTFIELGELFHGDGIMCGGLKVDHKFLEYFEELFPKDIILKGKIDKPGHWIEQRNQFVHSRWFVPYDLGLKDYNVELAFSFKSYVRNLKKKEKKNKKAAKKQKKKEYSKPFSDLAHKIEQFRPNNYDKYVKIFRNDERYMVIIDKLYPDLMDNDNKDDSKDDRKIGNDVDDLGPLFRLGDGMLKVTQLGWDILHYDVVEEVSNFLGELLKQTNVTLVKNVILVGGFAKSIFLQQKLIKDHSNVQFLTSKHAQLAVGIGALYWICQSSQATDSRKSGKSIGSSKNRCQLNKHRSKWTYGIAIDRPFNQNFDSIDRRVENTTGHGHPYMVYNAFDSLCEFNQNLPDGHTKEFDYTIPPNRELIEIPIFVTKSKSKRYVLNDGPEPVYPVKSFTFKIQKSNKPRDFKITFVYYHNGVKLQYRDPMDNTIKYIEVNHKV